VLQLVQAPVVLPARVARRTQLADALPHLLARLARLPLPRAVLREPLHAQRLDLPPPRRALLAKLEVCDAPLVLCRGQAALLLLLVVGSFGCWRRHSSRCIAAPRLRDPRAGVGVGVVPLLLLLLVLPGWMQLGELIAQLQHALHACVLHIRVL
jgi:hypothetical protein